MAEGFHLLEEALAAKCEIGAVIVAESASAVSHICADEARASSAVRDAVSRTRVDRNAAGRDRAGAAAGLDARPASARAMLWWWCSTACRTRATPARFVRAAEAFGATGAAFLKGSVNPYNPKCLRGSAGSVFRLPVVAALDESLLLAALEQKRVALYAAMPRAEKLVARRRSGGALRDRHRQRRARSQPGAGRTRDRLAHSDVRRRIAERGGRGRDSAVRSPPAEDGQRDEPVRFRAARNRESDAEASAGRAHAPRKARGFRRPGAHSRPGKTSARRKSSAINCNR